MIEVHEDHVALLPLYVQEGRYVPVLLQAESGERVTTLLGVASGAGVAGLHNLHRHLLAQPGTVAITCAVCGELGITDDAIAVVWDTDGHIWALQASLAPLAPPELPLRLLHAVTSEAFTEEMRDMFAADEGDAKMCRVPLPSKVRATLRKAVSSWSNHMK